jgi:L-Ala-D/L-Glu epimerase
MPNIALDVAVEAWPVDGTFTISRGSRREATVVVVTLSDGTMMGHGEAVPYPRYGETVDTVVAAIRSAAGVADRGALAQRLPAGAARNAIDCAL